MSKGSTLNHFVMLDSFICYYLDNGRPDKFAPQGTSSKLPPNMCFVCLFFSSYSSNILPHSFAYFLFHKFPFSRLCGVFVYGILIYTGFSGSSMPELSALRTAGVVKFTGWGLGWSILCLLITLSHTQLVTHNAPPPSLSNPPACNSLIDISFLDLADIQELHFISSGVFSGPLY